MKDEEVTRQGNRMILYRNLKYQNLFDDMCRLLMPGELEEGETRPDAYRCANRLIELAVTYGFEGNLWHCFLAFCMANHENAYSTSCEIAGEVQGTLKELAAHDFRLMRELFVCDIGRLDGEQSGIWKMMKHYRSSSGSSRVFNKRIRDRIVELAEALEAASGLDRGKNTETPGTGSNVQGAAETEWQEESRSSETADISEFQSIVAEFYRGFGVGKFGLNKAFRVEPSGEEVRILPITNVEHIYLEDLVGYELQKAKLVENTEAFIEGRAANNVLLFGDSGTGKSSSIKGILNRYYDRGLRMIEVYKHQFQCLSKVLEQIKDRNYKFIIYMDDLSFEEYEVEYKYLKAIIEGGLGKKPQNVLIYATSNRRHLIRENFSDKKDLSDDLHSNDTVQEKLSLVARFGVTIYYGSPDKRQFQEIVKVLSEKYHLEMPEEKLYLEANKWELSHGGLSGRTAAQFITHLLGKSERKED